VIVVIVVFRFLLLASVDTLALHEAFSVQQTANTPSANLIGILEFFDDDDVVKTSSRIPTVI
jgi:hypothetical protein